MTKFFSRFGLLPKCLYGNNSREKILKKLVDPERCSRLMNVFPDTLFNAHVEDFSLSPIVLCGALRPSELLERAQGCTSVVVYPYQGAGLDENYQWSVSAYLLEFPQPIEPVYSMHEVYELVHAKFTGMDDDIYPRV